MSSLFLEYYNQIPNDIEMLLKSLRNPIRIKICLKLMENDSLPFNFLYKAMELKKSAFYHHIKNLEISGLIQNYIENNPGLREHSYYEITEFGESFIGNLISKYNEIFNIKKNFIDKTTKIPKDFIDIIKALANKKRFVIIMYLKEIAQVSFSELVNFTGMEKSNLTTNIKKLEKSGLIENFFKKSDSSDYSFYRKTEIGNKITDAIINAYNQYYDESKLDDNNPNIVQNKELSNYINIGSTSWALPNEKILAWIEIKSSEIKKVELQLSNNLCLKNIFNIETTIESVRKSYNFDIIDQNINYIPFELYSTIPDGEKTNYFEEIIINGFNAKDEKISIQKTMIEIIKPIVKIDVKKNRISQTEGMFEIQLHFVNPKIQIKKINVNVNIEDENGKPIKINIIEKDPIDIESNIPPGVDIDNLMGQFNLNRNGTYIFNFQIKYFDLMDNQYISYSEPIEIKDSESFKGICNYNILGNEQDFTTGEIII